jgi:tetratricopeptide (TPR) repeat protein
VYRNFRANLEDILRVGERAGVPIVLSTVAVNLKDLAPFASLPSHVAGTNLPPDFASFAAAGASAQAAGDWLSALRSYEAAAQVVPRHAETEFRLGQCQLALSNRAAAQAAFSQARDDDALPFRTDSRLNAIIQEAGRAHATRGVHLYDAAAAMSAYSADGIAGDESFYEHVHYHFSGNYRLARGLGEKTAALLPAAITQRATNEWASQEACERDLGLADWNRRDVLDNVLRRLTQPPFAGQRDNPARRNHWQAQLNQVRTRLTTTNAATARALFGAAIQRQPEDFRLHWNFAEFLEAVRDLPGATEEWRQVQSLIPHHHVPHYQVGRLLAKQGREEEARQWLNQAVKLRPDLGAGWFELGTLSFTEARYDEALQHFHRARQFVPQDSRIPYQAARALVRLKRSNEAMRQAREALRLDPDFWEAHSLLGEELAFAGQAAEAQREFEATLRLKPEYALAHLNLGVACFKQGRRAEAVRHFEEALRLDPQLLLAKRYLEQLKASPPPAAGRSQSR